MPPGKPPRRTTGLDRAHVSKAGAGSRDPRDRCGDRPPNLPPAAPSVASTEQCVSARPSRADRILDAFLHMAVLGCARELLGLGVRLARFLCVALTLLEESRLRGAGKLLLGRLCLAVRRLRLGSRGGEQESRDKDKDSHDISPVLASEVPVGEPAIRPSA